MSSVAAELLQGGHNPPTFLLCSRHFSVMKVLLRHRETKLYVGRDPQTWVQRDKAQEYQNSALAIQAAMEHPAKLELEVLLSFDDPRYDISLPLLR